MRHERVLVVGSGGVGSAVVFALRDSGAVEVNVPDTALPSVKAILLHDDLWDVAAAGAIVSTANR